MKATIKTQTAGTISINSTFLNNKQWNCNVQNWNNHEITILHNGKKTSFDFWGSIMHPEIKTEKELVYAFYCFLSDGISAETNDFFDFCDEFGYEPTRDSQKIYNACKKSLAKIKNVFSCDIYDLINELQENYNL